MKGDGGGNNGVPGSDPRSNSLGDGNDGRLEETRLQPLILVGREVCVVVPTTLTVVVVVAVELKVLMTRSGSGRRTCCCSPFIAFTLPTLLITKLSHEFANIFFSVIFRPT